MIKLTYRKETPTDIALLLKYNRALPEIKEIVMKRWHLLHVNPNLAEIFQNPPILAFHQKKNFRDIIDTKIIENEIYKQNAR